MPERKFAGSFQIISAGRQQNTDINLDNTTRHLYEIVLQKAAGWGNTDNLMFVAGATQCAAARCYTRIVPDHFLLVPGVGTQGGSLEEVSRSMNKECGLLVNVSRAVIFAGDGEDFAEKAAHKAKDYAEQMTLLFNLMAYDSMFAEKLMPFFKIKNGRFAVISEQPITPITCNAEFCNKKLYLPLFVLHKLPFSSII